MRKLKWSVALKQLPRAALFSFGIALSLFMLASMGSMVLTGGEHIFGPSEARIVFATAFSISLICFVAVALLRARSDSADDDGGGVDAESQ
jgi:hypothetical protein